MSYRIPLRNAASQVVACAIVDQEDFERFGEQRWHLSSDGYARRSVRDGKVYLHRAIMDRGSGDGMFVDHINRDRLDNRRRNLRVVTRAEQQQNLSPRRNGSSSYRGVYFRKDTGKWCAQGKGPNGKRISLGSFDAEIDAARAASNHRKAIFPNSTEAVFA